MDYVRGYRRWWVLPFRRASPLVAALAAAGPDSDLSRRWDEEHDWHILRRALELLEVSERDMGVFEALVFEHREVAAVATEFGISPCLVHTIKFRTLRKLRDAVQGLVDLG